MRFRDPSPPRYTPPGTGDADLTRYDRYALGALVQAFGVFALILALIWWINGAVALVDTLLRDGQNLVTFLEFSALSLPAVIRIAVPVAAVAAAIYVTNRQRADSEVVAAHAAGASATRLARPALALGLIAAALLVLITHVLQPLSRERLDRRTAEVAEGATARLLTPGAFVEPADGVTFYVREITPVSELLDVLLSDARDPARLSFFTAGRALVLPADEAGRGAQLLMFDGLAQVRRDGRLYTTRFEAFVYDLGLFTSDADAAPLGPRDLTTPALIARADLGPLRWDEVARRSAESLTAIAGALLGFAAMMQGAFGRGGTWRQVLLAVTLVIVMRLVEGAATSLISEGRPWALHLVAPLFGLGMAAALLWNADRPRAPAPMAAPA